jgi:hypothetical protein
MRNIKTAAGVNLTLFFSQRAWSEILQSQLGVVAKGYPRGDTVFVFYRGEAESTLSHGVCIIVKYLCG